MDKTQIATLIAEERKKGRNIEAIKATLINSGHHDDEVEAGTELYLRQKGKKMMLVYAAIVLLIVLAVVLLNALQ